MERHPEYSGTPETHDREERRRSIIVLEGAKAHFYRTNLKDTATVLDEFYVGEDRGGQGGSVVELGLDDKEEAVVAKIFQMLQSPDEKTMRPLNEAIDFSHALERIYEAARRGH